MKYSFLSLFLASMLMTLLACNESSTIGNSLSEETASIYVDSNFTVAGQSRINSVVQSRTVSQLLGSVDAAGFGSIQSDFVAQFMPSLDLDTVDITANNIDSVKMFLQMQRDAFTGDSLVPMGLEVFRLTKDLPYPIYSDFDPADYYNPAEMMASAIYTASTINEPDSVKKLDNIYVTLPLDVDFGRELFKAYEDNPSVFADPDIFTKDVFKGIYVRNSYGNGRISDFTINSIRLYYHKNEYDEDLERDTIMQYVGDYFAVTPEVVVNNNIKYNPAAELTQMIAAGEQIIAAPAGYEVDIQFPAPEIIERYNEFAGDLRVINSLTFTLPADSIQNKYSIAPPPYILMVPKNKKDDFFANNKLPDNTTSFYAIYNEADNCYTFSGMRQYLLHLLDLEEITADDYTFTLTPVQVETETSSNSNYYYGTSSVVSRIVPYVSKPAMVKISLDKAKIYFTFSTGKSKN